MPAPKILSFLPKPLLFGLYGAVGGLLGALVFGELLYNVLTPSGQIAVAASKEIEVFVDGRNALPVKITRGGFDGPVTIRVEDLPPGVTAEPVTIPAEKSEGEVTLIGASNAQTVAGKQAKVIAEDETAKRKISDNTSVTVKVSNPPKPLADIVFVLDVSPSMQWALDDLKNGIGKFTDALAKARIDFRLALVTFQTLNGVTPKTEIVEFKGGPFTTNSDEFRGAVGNLRIQIGSGGGVLPQCSLDGIDTACKQPFRKDATKVLLLITGQAPQPAANARTVEDSAKRVRASDIDAVHTVVHRLDEQAYKPLTEAGLDKAGGKYFNLSDVVRGDDGFDGVLTSFGSAVYAAAIAKNPESAAQRGDAPKSLQSNERSAAGTEGQLVLRSGVWTGAIASLICLLLMAGQQHYLRGRFPSVGGIIVGLLGGLIVGLIGGAAGQGLFLLAKTDNHIVVGLFRVMGWTILGGLAGAGLSLFIPNMKSRHGLIGGAIGGAVGAIGFIVVENEAGALLGRLAGGLALGFCIGLMVAVVERAFRRAWLEVQYGSREKITVTLGPEPVKVGSDARTCTIWARGAEPVEVRFFVRDGQVICDDYITDRETEVSDGFEKEVGTLTVTVRTGSGSSESPRRAKPAKKKKPQYEVVEEPEQQKKPSRLDEDDGFDLPMPMESSKPAPAQPITKETPPPGPATPLPKPPAPPVPSVVAPPVPVPTPQVVKPPMPPMAKPPAVPAPPAPSVTKPAAPQVAKPTARNPDACPSCGRVIPGKPGTRYCMICDQTF